MLLAILAAAAVTAGPEAPASATAPAEPKKARSEMVCIREKVTGSNRPTKVCYPRKAPPADGGAARMPQVDPQR